MSEEKPKAPKTSLSKNLMGMKFMQRQQEAELRKKLENEQRKKIDESHWVTKGFETESFPTVSLMNESTFDFSVGRRSFNSFNLTVEKLEEETYAKDTEKQSKTKKTEKKKYNLDDETDISSIQMSNKLTSFKRNREQMDPPNESIYTPKNTKNTKNDANFYQRNRKSKKAMKYKK